MKNSNFSQLGANQLYDLAKFVVKENFIHHSKYINSQQLEDGVDAVYKEEAKFNNSKIFVSRDSTNEINGSIRVLKWNSRDTLPIEKLFDIKPSLLTSSTGTEIWHIGRFAIKQFSDKAGFSIFKILMTFAINEVCRNENSIALAECDVKLLKILRLLGIEAETLADPIYYLGSETIPVLLTYKGLKHFLDKNYYLIPQNFMCLHNSVVFQEIA